MRMERWEMGRLTCEELQANEVDYHLYITSSLHYFTVNIPI